MRSVVRVSEEEVSSKANQNGEKRSRQWHWQGAETRRIERERVSFERREEERRGQRRLRERREEERRGQRRLRAS